MSVSSVPDKRRLGYPWSVRRHEPHPVVRKFEDSRTFGERVADAIARFGGSWPFIFIFLGFIGAWMVLNSLVIARIAQGKPFDPYPYIALNLALSAMAGLQAPIIMMSQNRAAARDEALAAHHYEESQRAEALLTNQQQLLDLNTDLTRKVHDLTVEIRRFVSSAPGAGG